MTGRSFCRLCRYSCFSSPGRSPSQVDCFDLLIKRFIPCSRESEAVWDQTTSIARLHRRHCAIVGYLSVPWQVSHYSLGSNHKHLRHCRISISPLASVALLDALEPPQQIRSFIRPLVCPTVLGVDPNSLPDIVQCPRHISRGVKDHGHV